MRKTILLTAAAAIILVPVFLKLLKGCRRETRQGTVLQAPPVRAESYRVRDTVVFFPLRAVGYLKAREAVDVVSELSGRVAEVGFREGSQVPKGALLFQLDDSEYQASLRKNAAQLELALQAELRNADLLKSGGISLHAYEESVSRRKVLEAEAEWLKVMIGKMQVRAPFAGRTGIRNVSPGAYVSPGQLLTRLDDLSHLEVDFTVPRNQAAFIRAGDSLTFRRSGDPAGYPAVVKASDPAVDKSTGSLRVLASLLSPNGNLVPGQAVTITMQGKAPGEALYIPAQALLPVPSGYRVYAVKNGTCQAVNVTTGLRTENMVEVTGGVERGDTLLLTGFMKVKPGNRVQIVKTW